MGKGKALTFTVFAALGAICGYATYMAKHDKFSDETIDNYDQVINKAKNVGIDIKRTYTSIGDEKEFTENTKNLGNSALKLAGKAGNLVASATGDMFKSASKDVKKTINNFKDDDNSTYDDLDDSHISTKKKSVKKLTTKKTNKKASSKKK